MTARTITVATQCHKTRYTFCVYRGGGYNGACEEIYRHRKLGSLLFVERPIPIMHERGRLHIPRTRRHAAREPKQPAVNAPFDTFNASFNRLPSLSGAPYETLTITFAGDELIFPPRRFANGEASGRRLDSEIPKRVKSAWDQPAETVNRKINPSVASICVKVTLRGFSAAGGK